MTDSAAEAWKEHVTSVPQDHYPSIPLGGWADIRTAYLTGYSQALTDVRRFERAFFYVGGMVVGFVIAAVIFA